MARSVAVNTTMLAQVTAPLDKQPTLKRNPKTGLSAVHRRAGAVERLTAAYRAKLPTQEPRTKWVGDEYRGACPISTLTKHFQASDVKRGLHVLDMFSGITCGGLRTVLEAGYKVKCYTSVEIDDTSRAIARCVLGKLQAEYPGQLPDSAIRAYNKRLPQDVSLIQERDLVSLVQYNGPIRFICGGWEFQPMSLAGMHGGMEDQRFNGFLDIIKILNFLQK